MTDSLHPVQAQILTSLLLAGKMKFSELNKTEDMTNDWFSYHVRQVLNKGWVQKSSDLYELTSTGKNFALQIDIEKLQIAPTQRVSVLLVLQNSEHFLVQQRLSEPFSGFWEFPTARVPFGQNPEDFAQELLQKETSLEAEFIFKGINHKVEMRNEALFDDKYFLVFYCNQYVGDLKSSFPGGENHWLTKNEFLLKEKTHFDLANTFVILEKNQLLTSVIGELEKEY